LENRKINTEESKKQAEILAKIILTGLERSINAGWITYPYLLKILISSLRKTICEVYDLKLMDELRHYLQETELENLYQIVKEIEKRELERSKIQISILRIETT
jgi:hypothetical protein